MARIRWSLLVFLLLASLAWLAPGPASAATEPDDTWVLPIHPQRLQIDETTGWYLAEGGPLPGSDHGQFLNGIGPTGQVAWTIDDIDVQASDVRDGVAYVESRSPLNDFSLVAIDITTGATIDEWALPGGSGTVIATEGHVWVNADGNPDTIGRVDLATGDFTPDAISLPSWVSLLDVTDDSSTVIATDSAEIIRFDVTGPNPVETHRRSRSYNMKLSDDGQHIRYYEQDGDARTLVTIATDDLTTVQVLPDPERMLSDVLVELNDGSILSKPSHGYYMTLISGTTGELLGMLDESLEGELLAVGDGFAFIERFSNEITFWTPRPSTNAASLGPIELDQTSITLAGSFLDHTTEVIVGGQSTSFTINPAARSASFLLEPATLTVELPDLTPGVHSVVVRGLFGQSNTSAANQLTVREVSPRQPIEILNRADSADTASVSVSCDDPARSGTTDLFDVSNLAPGESRTVHPVVGASCSISRDRATLVGQDVTHITSGFFDPATDRSGTSTIDLEQGTSEFEMPDERIGYSVFVPQSNEAVLWTYAYGSGTPTAGTRSFVLDCPGTVYDTTYVSHFGNFVRSIVPRATACQLSHPAPAGAIESGIGETSIRGGVFGGPTNDAGEAPFVFEFGSTLLVIYDIYPHPSEDDGAFARQQYLDFLGRQGDSGGLAFWEDALSSGTKGRTDLVKLFLDSPEFGGTVAPVNRLYSAYFDRAPDRTGLFFWVDWIRDGRTLSQVSDQFARSPEFEATYGSLSDEDFIDLVYRNVLDRLPDARGRAFWVDQMRAGLTRGQLMASFSESPEYVDRTRSAVLIESLYQGLLQRSPDSSGFAYWVSVAEAGEPVSNLIAGMLSSDEYRSRFESVYEAAPSGAASLQGHQLPRFGLESIHSMEDVTG